MPAANNALTQLLYMRSVHVLQIKFKSCTSVCLCSATLPASLERRRGALSGRGRTVSSAKPSSLQDPQLVAGSSFFPARKELVSVCYTALLRPHKDNY